MDRDGEFLELSVELQKAAETGEQVVSRVDIPLAVVRGRARLRRRRLAAAAGAMSVLLCTGALAAWSGGGGGAVATPAVPAPSPGTPSASGAASAPANGVRGVDPLTSEVRFGWLPDWADGRTGVGYELGYHGNQATARGTGEDSPRIVLMLHPAGPEPEPGTRAGESLTKVAAPEVNGRAAYWLVPVGGGETHALALRWLTASGRWADLYAYPMEGAAAKDMLLRVAGDARFGTWEVPLPVQFTGLPAAFKATDVSLFRPDTDGKGAWSLWLAFTVEGKVVSVNVAPVKAAPSEPAATPTELLDGGVYADPNPPTCTTMRGVEVCVSQPQGGVSAVERLGGLPGLLERIGVTGMDDSTWTTDVIR